MAGLQSTIDGLNELNRLLGEIERKYKAIELASEDVGGSVNVRSVDRAEDIYMKAQTPGGYGKSTAAQVESEFGGTEHLEKSIALLKKYNEELTKIGNTAKETSQTEVVPVAKTSITKLEELRTLLGDIEKKYLDIEKVSQASGGRFPERSMRSAAILHGQASSYKGIAERDPSEFSLGSGLDPELIDRSLVGARGLHQQITEIYNLTEQGSDKPILEATPHTGLDEIKQNIIDINGLLGQPSTGVKLLSSIEGLKTKTSLTKDEFEALVDLAIKFSNTLVKAGSSGTLSTKQIDLIKSKGGVLTDLPSSLEEAGYGTHPLDLSTQKSLLSSETISGKIDEGQEVTRIQLTDNWAASLTNLKEVLKGISDEDLEKTFDKIKETISSTAKAMSGLDTVIEKIDLSWNEKANEIRAAFQTRSGAGTVQHIGKDAIGFDIEGEVTTPAAPRRIIKQAGQADILDSAALGRSSALYERITQEMDKYEKQLVDAGKASSDFSIQLKSVDAVVNETGSSVEISAQYMKQFSDATAEAGKTAREFKVEGTKAAPDLEPVIPQTKLQSAMSLFQGTQAQTTAQASLTKALKDTGLTLDDVAKSEKDSAAGLTRITMASQTAGNSSNRLTVILDKQGKVVQDLRTRYSGFFGSLQKNFARVMRFALVSSVIYKGLNQLQQIPALLGDIDEATSRLAAISGQSLGEVNQYFNGIIQAARTFGVEAADALGGAEAALQAVGGTDQEKATALLTDSMLIAKVTGDSLSGSLDMLVAALSQYNMELDDGSELIGKWILLNRSYNVSMTQLARTYAVAGTQARDLMGTTEEAMDTFNGMITVLAKLTPMSSSQLGNFFKTTLTNFSSPTIAAGLEEYGISAKDSEGNLRDFQDVLEDIYNYTVKFEARGPDALSNITRILGGGGSKQATQLAILIQNYEEVGKAAQVSASTQQQAADEYEAFIKTLTDNLKTDFGELQLAVTQFFKAFGESEMIPQLRDIVQTLTNVIDKFAESPEAVGAFLSVVTGTIPKIMLLNKAMLGLTPVLQGVFTTVGGLGIKSFADLKAGLQLLTGEVLKNRMSMQSAGISIGAALFEGISSAAAGDTAGESIAQGLVTALLGIGGSAIFGVPGAMIGIAIADQINRAFAKELQFARTIEEELDLAGELSDEFLMGLMPEDSTDEDAADLAIKIGAEGMLDSSHTQGMRRVITEALTSGEDVESIIDRFPRQEEEIRAIWEYYDEISSAVRKGKEETAAALAEQEETEALSAYAAPRQAAIRRQYVDRNPQLEVAQESRSRQYLSDYLSEDISVSDYTRLKENLVLAPEAAVPLWDALADNVEDFSYTYDDLVRILTEAPPGSMDIITGMVTQMVDLESEIERAKDSNLDFAESYEMLEKMATDANDILGLVEQKTISRVPVDLSMPGATRMEDTTKEEYETQVRPLAIQAQKDYTRLIYEANVQKYAEMGFDSYEAFYEAFIANIEAHPLLLEDGMIMVDDITAMFAGMGKAGADALNEELEKGFNVRRLKDVDPSQMAEIEAGNRYWTNYLASVRGQSPEDYLAEEGEDMNLILGENNTFQKILTTNEAMNFTLQDILDTEKKQLEGMWNIPEGATFWVPLSSAFNQKGGGGGYPELPEIQDTRTRAGGVAAEEVADVGDKARIDSIKASATRLSDLTWMASRKMLNLGEDQWPVTSEISRTEKISPTHRGWQDWAGKDVKTQPTFKGWQDWGGKDLERDPATHRGWQDWGGRDPTAENIGQQMTFNVVVPEPKEIRVESTINTTVMLDGAPILRFVSRAMAKEQQRITKNTRYTMGVV